MRIQHFINGAFVDPRSGRFAENIEPATGAGYSEVALGDAADVEAAVQSAANAFPSWSNLRAAERSAALLRIAEGIEDRLEEFAKAESIDVGKPITLARTVDIPRAVHNFRFFATAILHTQSESHAMDNIALNYTLRKPLGVTGLISPWNLPLYLLSWKIAPAIATGNTAVAKPSEMTPMTACLLSQVCSEKQLPPGVLNIVHGLGTEAGAAICDHDAVKAISFTGGTATGSIIARAAAPKFKKLSLELGGKNPNIIFADADLDAAIETTVRSSFANQGQICLCGSRIFVARAVYDAVLSRLVEGAGSLKIGDPLLEDTKQGAVISSAHREKVMSYIHLAREEGGAIECGGRLPETLPERCRNGFFVEPTVITGLSADCRTNREEIFGPVVSVMPFDSEDEVIGLANGTRYGLSATVWTRDLNRALRVCDQLDAGTVWVNCWLVRDLRVPFGGVKDSGVGREGGDEALRFFTEPKNVCVKL